MLIEQRYESLNPGKKRYVATAAAEAPTVTNAKFATKDKLFQAACSLAGIDPTPRQASKWRRGTGLAHTYRAEALAEIRNEEAADE
jgi:hypothetical protein